MIPDHAGKSLARLLQGVIAVLAVILVLELVFVVLLDSSAGEAGYTGGPYRGSQPPVIRPPQPLDYYQEAVDRSLFSWNRQPKVAEEGANQQGELADRWQMTGVINTGDAIYAIFNEVDGSLHLRLEEGMYLEKWKVESISAEAVTLTSDQEEQVFRLKETQNAAPVHKNGVKKTVSKEVQEAQK